MSFGLLRDNNNLMNKLADAESRILVLENEIKLLHSVVNKLVANTSAIGAALEDKGPKALKDNFRVDEHGWMLYGNN